MSYFDQPLIHDLRDMIAKGGLAIWCTAYARLMHKGGMMWSTGSVAGAPTGADRSRNRRRLLYSARGALHPHLRVGQRGACGARHRVHPQPALSGPRGRRLGLACWSWIPARWLRSTPLGAPTEKSWRFTERCGRFEYRNNRWLSLAIGGRTVYRPGGALLGRLTRRSAARRARSSRRSRPPALADAANPLNQHRAFLEAVRDGCPAGVSIASGVHDMRVVTAVYASASSGRAVEVA